jgi:hypothetical protein
MEISNTINFYQQNSAIIMIIIITSSISNHRHKDVLTQTNELLRIEFHKCLLVEVYSNTKEKIVELFLM